MENESTSATTRQYVPQQPANPYDAPYQSQLAQARSAPDNQFDDQPPDTSRLYQTPMAQHYPNYPANYQQAVVRKSGALMWILITLLCLLLVSGGIVLTVIMAIRGAEHATEAPVAPAPPAPPNPNSGKGLEQYKYPNATVKEAIDILGNEVVTMITSDSISVVGNYYKKQLGDPMVENEGAAVMFQITGTPTTFITINHDEEDRDKTRITVIQSPIKLPRMN